MKFFDIGGLSARLPIIQGGMGVGISLSSLAGAVSLNGGIGVISAAQPGFLDPDFAANPLQANIRALANHIRAAKEISRGAPVGVNIMVALNNYAELVKCCVENKADIIISGAGLPVNLPELVGLAKIKIAPIVSSLKAGKVLLNLWDRRYSKTADMVIVEGPLAGGHLGFTTGELKSPPDMTLVLKDLKELLSFYEGKYMKKIPLVFAGGVYDAKDVRHYINEVGIDAVQIASRFVVTDECDAHINFKKAYLDAKEEDIAIVKSPVGMPGRAIRNAFIKRIEQGNEPPDRCYSCIRSCDRKTIPYCVSKALISAAKGDVDDALLFCGSKTFQISEMTTVKKLLEELSSEL